MRTEPKRMNVPPLKRLRHILTQPVFRSAAVFLLIMGVFYAFVHSPQSASKIFNPHLRMIASTTGGILRLAGFDATVSDTKIITKDITVKIVRGCDAIEPMAAFIAAVLASPVSMWPKLMGIIIGTLSLFVINFVRIISLFWVGMYYPDVFTFMHESIWQAAFILLAIMFWAFWVKWASRKPRRQSNHGRQSNHATS